MYSEENIDLELFIDNIEIDGKDIPIKNMRIKLNMETTPEGLIHVNDMSKGNIIINGNIKLSVIKPGSHGRSWNMNIDRYK
jgi:hypothetical protein